MLKSRNLFLAGGLSVFIVLLAASNFADRFITPLPLNAATVSPEVDRDFRMIAAAQASVVGPRDGKFGLGRQALPIEIEGLSFFSNNPPFSNKDLTTSVG